MVVMFFGAFWVLLFLLFVGMLLVRPCMFCMVGFFPSYPACLAPFADPGATAFLEGTRSANSSSVLANRYIWFILFWLYGRLGWKWRLVVPPSGFLNALASRFGLVALEWFVMLGEISCKLVAKSCCINHAAYLT